MIESPGYAKRGRQRVNFTWMDVDRTLPLYKTKLTTLQEQERTEQNLVQSKVIKSLSALDSIDQRAITFSRICRS